MNDELGKRMKENYENRTRFSIPRRTYTIVRVDGKAFHSFTKNYERPFDRDLMNLMDQTAIALCKGIQGAVLGYTQSDEISIVICDFATPHTDAWFDGNIQKMASISASMATAAFNKALLLGLTTNTGGCQECGPGSDVLYKEFLKSTKLATFDSRVFTIPDRSEVLNYFIWRQQDATRNSIQMAAQALYSQKELHGKNTSVLQEMMFQKGINWNDYTSGEKLGRAIVKEQYIKEVEASSEAFNSSRGPESVVRTRWISLDGTNNNETPSFTVDKEFLLNKIPKLGE